MPGKPPDPELSAESIARWHERRGRLLAMLDEDPDGAWAWLWRVHLDIMDYLIHRYAAGASDTDLQPTRSASSTRQSRAAPALDADTPDPLRPPDTARVMKAATLDGPAVQQLRETQRSRLSSLHSTNDKRKASEPPISPALVPKQYHRLTPEGLDALQSGAWPMPMPVWLERVLLMPVQWPPRLADPAPRPAQSDAPPPGADDLRWVRWMVYPEDAPESGVATETTGVEPLDSESIDLLRRAIAEDQDWDLPADEALSDDEIARLLSGGHVEPDAGVDA